MVSIHVKWLSESVGHVFRNYHVSTAPQPDFTNMLVRPKDIQELENKCEAVYKIPC